MKCSGCEFCFPDSKNGGFVCADKYYGKNITDSLEEDKDCYSEGFDDFVDREERNKTVYKQKTTLKDIKLDGRRTLYLYDKDNLCIETNKKYALEYFPDINILTSKDDMVGIHFELDTHFDQEIMNGKRMIIIKKSLKRIIEISEKKEVLKYISKFPNKEIIIKEIIEFKKLSLDNENIDLEKLIELSNLKIRFNKKTEDISFIFN